MHFDTDSIPQIWWMTFLFTCVHLLFAFAWWTPRCPVAHRQESRTLHASAPVLTTLRGGALAETISASMASGLATWNTSLHTAGGDALVLIRQCSFGSAGHS